MMRNICIFVSLPLVLPLVDGQRFNLTVVDFMHIKEEKTWEEAQAFCRENHTDLVTIRNEKENQVFDGLWGWIGLYRDSETSPWKWSGGQGTENYSNWADNEPDEVETELCVLMFTPVKWHDFSCQETEYFICYDDKLVLVKEKKTWEEALEHCRSLSGEHTTSVPGEHIYDLATLITADDHDYARERAQQANTDEVWTGLRFLGDEWFWMGGEPVLYQDIPNCLAFRCGVLEKNSNNFFGIRDCSERKNFFCYKKPKNL
ncbi:putative C-type lectin domain family 20 member A [Menidia menidia]